MPHSRRHATVETQLAWADWPEAVRSTADAVVFHISRGDLGLALSLLDGMVTDLGWRRDAVSVLCRRQAERPPECQDGPSSDVA